MSSLIQVHSGHTNFSIELNIMYLFLVYHNRVVKMEMDYDNHFHIARLEESVFDIFENDFTMLMSLSHESEPILMTF